MAAKGRSLAAVLQEGLAEKIVKEQEACRRKLKNLRARINEKHLSYKGVHRRDLHAETLMPEWKIKQHFSSTPVALK